MAVDRLADLRRTCGADRPFGAMEVEAPCVPWQPATGDDAARRACQIRNQLLVAHVDDTPRRQHPAPMLHQGSVVPVIAAKLGEIVGVGLLAGEMHREARHAGVDGIAHGMNDGRVRQRQMDQAGEDEISRHFIGNARCVRRPLPEPIAILRAERPKMLRRHVRNHLGKRQRARQRIAEAAGGLVEQVEFAGAKDLRMARQDLLDQRRARARHADDEDRKVRRIAGVAVGSDEFRGEQRARAVEARQCRGFVVGDLPTLEGIAG